MGTLFSLKIPSHKRGITTCMSKYNLKIIWPCSIVNSLSEFQENILIHYHTMLHFDTPKIYSFWLIEWCFMPLSTVFQSYHSYSSHYSSFLGFTSTRLGSEESRPRTLPRKKPEDPVRFKPRDPGLRVKHFTTEPRRTLFIALGNIARNNKIACNKQFPSFSQCFFTLHDA